MLGRDRVGLQPDSDTDYHSKSLSIPHLLRSRDARGRLVTAHQGICRSRKNLGGHPPLVRASALPGVSHPHCGAGSHLGSTINPGRSVLTGGVFRRSGSVACIRANASPSEVLVWPSSTTSPAAVKLINAFLTRTKLLKHFAGPLKGC
jgi:hypothetical protein